MPSRGHLSADAIAAATAPTSVKPAGWFSHRRPACAASSVVRARRDAILIVRRNVVDRGTLGGMPQNLDALERAFQIARSGKASSVVDIKKTLRREGYDERAVEGHALSRQLSRLIKDAKSIQLNSGASVIREPERIGREAEGGSPPQED